MALTFSEESHLLSKGTHKMALFKPSFYAQKEVFCVNLQPLKFAGFVKNHSWRFCIGGIDKTIQLSHTYAKAWSNSTYTAQSRLFILSLYSFGHFYVVEEKTSLGANTLATSQSYYIEMN